MDNIDPVLVTGATGYVGGRLVPQLLSAGRRVRVLGRSITKLQARPWAGHLGVELVQADVMDRESLIQATRGCRTGFYLVHSMNARHKDFSAADRDAARNMASAAEQVGMKRLIYLGGLGEEGSHLSKHLRSRTEVASIFQQCSVPTTCLRAAMILGSGSASFEILRYLVEHLPVMITPRWVRNPVQPIAIRNVLNYLQGCLEHEETAGKTFDIGGPDILTYQDLMDIYGEEAGLRKRLVFPVHFLTPRLSSYWIHLVTPVPSYIARPLAEGLKNPVICRENTIRSIIVQELIGCKQAIRLALGRTQKGCLDTCWTDAGEIPVPEWLQIGDAPYAGGTILKSGYRMILKASPEEIWAPLSKIGGKTGWYGSNFLWRMRSLMDRMTGGIGLRRGRRDPEDLKAGDAVDFFRVLSASPAKNLQLLAEMKFPGEAVLEFEIIPIDGERTELRQITRYVPRGLSGLIYWYALYPFHEIVFSSMLKGIAEAVKKPVLMHPKKLFI